MSRRNRVILYVVLALVVVGSLVVRAWVDGRAQLRQADAFAASGDLDGEIRLLGRAARWRLPLAEHDEEARERLRGIAERESEAGHVDTALIAWRELRSAILATRTIGVVDPEQLAQANAAIVELMVADAESKGETPDSARWAAEPRGRANLARTQLVGCSVLRRVVGRMRRLLSPGDRRQRSTRAATSVALGCRDAGAARGLGHLDVAGAGLDRSCGRPSPVGDCPHAWLAGASTSTADSVRTARGPLDPLDPELGTGRGSADGRGPRRRGRRRAGTRGLRWHFGRVVRVADCGVPGFLRLVLLGHARAPRHRHHRGALSQLHQRAPGGRELR